MSKNPPHIGVRIAVTLITLGLVVIAPMTVLTIRTQYDYIDHYGQKTVMCSLAVFAVLFISAYRHKALETAGLAGAGALITLAMGAAFEMDSGKYGGAYMRCCSNLQNVGIALEMYSTDFEGRFPRHLAALTPNYLKSVPTCPSAQHDTYSSGFASARTVGANGKSLDVYTVVCAGGYHESATQWPANYPQYSSTAGLIGPAARSQ